VVISFYLIQILNGPRFEIVQWKPSRTQNFPNKV
jgi:hypothetical protein